MSDVSKLLFFLDQPDFPEGQIFLANLLLGLRQGLIHPAPLIETLQKVVPKLRSRSLHIDILGSIAALLTHKGSPVLLQNPRDECFGAFTNASALYFVCEKNAFVTFYADVESLTSGHSYDQHFLPKNIGKSFKTKHSAQTNSWFWATSVSKFSTSENLNKASRTNAVRMRNVLGLIQHKVRHLFAIEIRPKTAPKVYRPTVVEAIPNARFLQAPKASDSDTDWGWTADMERIDSTAANLSDLFGLPELVAEKLEFKSCAVEAFYLGESSGDSKTIQHDSKETHLEFLRVLKASLGNPASTASEIDTFLKNNP